MTEAPAPPTPDLTFAAEQLATLVRKVPEDLFATPTPCPDYALGDLLDHIGGFALAFTAAARKEVGAHADAAPIPDVANLEPGWRARIAGDVAGLAVAWKNPSAWSGMTKVGGVELPGAAAGMFALDELVIHGWDLARASRQPFQADEPSLVALHGMLSELMAAGPPVPGLFGTPVEVDRSEPLLDRVVGLTGRQPAW